MRTLFAPLALALACSLTSGADATSIPESDRPPAPPPSGTQPYPYEPPMPPPQRVQLPPMQFDASCLGQQVQEEYRRTGGSGRSSSPTVPSVATAPSAPPPAAAPVASSGSSAPSEAEDLAGYATAGRGDTSKAPAAEAAKSSPVQIIQGKARPTDAPMPDARARETKDEDNSAMARNEPQLDRAPYAQPPRGPTVDWGGVVHLSNDDSMSLASAQRLLYALDRRASFSVQQIRPHELLNYFTFDTTSPGHETFAVNASAERVDGDTLALALAVRGATPPRSDLDLTVLIDRSGSMSAEGRMSYTHRALHKMAGNLRNGDRLDVVLFDDRVCTPLKNFVVGRDDPSLLSRVIDSTQPRGSTDLDLGLKEAYRVALEHVGQGPRAGRVMVFTDAILNTGDVNPETVSEVGRALDAHDIRLSGIGVGSEFRDDVLNRITEKGKGAYVFLGSEKVVDRLFGQGFNALVQTIAEDVRFALDLPDSLGMERFYGEESSRDPADVQPVNFQAGNTQVFLEDLAIRNGWIDEQAPITLTMSWTDPASHQPRQQQWTTTVGQALHADTHNVRKAQALMKWTDTLTAHAMGSETCGGPFGEFKQASSLVPGDAEIAYIDGLISSWCGTWAPPVARWSPSYAPTKVRIDSDQPVGAMDLDCQGQRFSESLTGSDTVATFQAPAGTCKLTLHGVVPMTSSIQVPPTGGDVRCVIRGGRVSCG